MIFGSSIIAFPLLSTEFLIELCMNALLSPLMFFVLSFLRQFIEQSPKKAVP